MIILFCSFSEMTLEIAVIIHCMPYHFTATTHKLKHSYSECIIKIVTKKVINIL